MRSGEAQTTWFPEIISILKKQWKSDMTIAEHFKLVANLNKRLNQIRSDNNIQQAIIFCPVCNAWTRQGKRI